MSQSIVQIITECEERLKQAMLQSDVTALDSLLATDLIFTNHLGQLMSKQDDLDAHRSGMLKIQSITLAEQRIKAFDAVAVVSVQAHSFADEVSESDFRFTRVWRKSTKEAWQVVVGHSSRVTPKP